MECKITVRIGFALLLKVDVIRSPIADDNYSRIYWSGDSRMGGAIAFLCLQSSSLYRRQRIPDKLLQVRDSCAKEKTNNNIGLLHLTDDFKLISKILYLYLHR